MRKESFQGILLGIVIMCAVFAFITIAWAGFSSNLEIGGTATINAQEWDIDFTNTKDTKWTASQSLTGSSNAEVKSGTNASISSATLAIGTDRTVSGIIGTFNQEGDEITYKWYIQNFGSFNSEISVVGTNSKILSAADANGGNIELKCTEVQTTESDGDKNDWCATNMVATLTLTPQGTAGNVTTPGSPVTVLAATTASLPSKTAASTDDTDIIEVKLVVKFIGSSSAVTPAAGITKDATSDVPIRVEVAGVKLVANQVA